MMKLPRAPLVVLVWTVLTLVATAAFDPRQPPTPDPAAIALADALSRAAEPDRGVVLAQASPEARKGLNRALLVRSSELRGREENRAALSTANLAVWAMTTLGDRAGVAAALLERGIDLAETSDVAAAVNAFNESSAICESLHDVSCQSRAINNLGIVQRRTGDYAGALDAYQRALAIQEANNERALIAQTFNNMGIVYRDLGSYSRSVEYHQKALAIEQASATTKANALSNLGAVFDSQGEYAKALDHFRRAKAVAVAANRSTAGIDNNIGHALYNLGQYDEATQVLQQVVDFARAHELWSDETSALYNLAAIRYERNDQPGALTLVEDSLAAAEKTKNPVKVAEALTFRGEIRARLGDLERAEADTRRALSLVSGPQAAGPLWEAQTLVGQIALARGDRGEARRQLEAAIQTIEGMRWQVAGNEQSFESFFEGKTQPYHLMVELLADAGDTSGALRYAEEARARVLLDVLERGRISESGARRVRSAPLTIEDAVNLAGDGVLLEFVVTERRTFVFTVTRGEHPIAVRSLAIDHDALGKRVAAFRTALESRDLTFAKEARALYDLLLGPDAAAIRNKHAIVIVPDGDLWDLPFQALQSPSRRFLIEDALVSYAPSLRVLAQERKGAAARPEARQASVRRLLAAGAIRGADTDLAPLPGVERQVRAIATLYGPDGLALTGAAASERRFKEEAARSSVLHFAGHGVLNNANPMYSHISLAPPRPGDEEDGRLEAREMMELPLTADLAVLSACETARGRTGSGEGILGMAWALSVAGVPATLASQWRVDEASTEVLMQAFHRRLKSSWKDGARGRAAALAGAARELLAQPRYRHPFYWAGFVLVGDGT